MIPALIAAGVGCFVLGLVIATYLECAMHQEFCECSMCQEWRARQTGALSRRKTAGDQPSYMSYL